MGLDMDLYKVKKRKNSKIEDAHENGESIGYWRKYYDLATVSCEVCNPNTEYGYPDDFIVSKDDLIAILGKLETNDLSEWQQQLYEYTVKLFEELEEFDFKNYFLVMSLSY